MIRGIRNELKCRLTLVATSVSRKQSSQHGIKLITWSFHEKGSERVILIP